MKPHYTNGLYTTYSEKKFIDGLGTMKFSAAQSVAQLTREELLGRYLSSCYNRQLWGKIDKNEVIRYTQSQILLERAGGKRIVYF